MKTIWTIGHSTRTLEDFLSILASFNIEVLADVRNFPGSKRYPHFNKETLADALMNEQVEYVHFKDLGGRRKPVTGSVNTAWRNDAFRGYADYMGTAEFKKSIDDLKAIASNRATAYMCSEAVWWSCHRSLISDQLKAEGWKVIHIMDKNKGSEHPYTKPARIVNGKLSYTEPGLFETDFGN
jgi:uncharacterized protein (DUF488 family)